MAAAGKPGGVKVKPDVREGLCGCGSCRHTRGPAVCWSVATEKAVVSAGPADSAAAEDSVGAADSVAAAEDSVGAEDSSAAEAGNSMEAEDSASAKAEEASAGERRRASTPAVSRPVRSEPQPLGPEFASRARHSLRAEAPRLPTPERRFDSASVQDRHWGGLRAPR
jgi:hypothetical protein